MRAVLIHLREAADVLSQTERPVADYLLDHADEAVSLSIHALSERTFASPSTIVRMCRRLGFEGYKDMRSALAYELAVRNQNREMERREISRANSLEDIVDIITHKNVSSLEDTRMLMDVETLRQCVDLVRNSRSILLFGIGASLVAAQDAHLKFLRLNKPCFISSDWHSQYLQAKNSTPEDVGIAISYSGKTVEVIECMKALKENHTPIIAITRGVPTPVSKLADLCLHTTSGESLFRSGAMSSRISQLNIIDILYTAFANSDYENSLEQLSRTRIIKPGETTT